MYEAPKPAAKPVQPQQMQNEAAAPSNDVSDDELDDLTSDPDDLPAVSAPKPAAESEDISEDELNDLVDGIDDI